MRAYARKSGSLPEETYMCADAEAGNHFPRRGRKDQKSTPYPRERNSNTFARLIVGGLFVCSGIPVPQRPEAPILPRNATDGYFIVKAFLWHFGQPQSHTADYPRYPHRGC